MAKKKSSGKILDRIETPDFYAIPSPPTETHFWHCDLFPFPRKTKNKIYVAVSRFTSPDARNKFHLFSPFHTLYLVNSACVMSGDVHRTLCPIKICGGPPGTKRASLYECKGGRGEIYSRYLTICVTFNLGSEHSSWHPVFLFVLDMKNPCK